MNHRFIAEICSINPRMSAALSVQKDRIVDFVPMASVGEDGRITVSETRLLNQVQKGYTYFENGDVIVAKITPCMENGKAAHVNNLPNGIALGSTEFHVLRPTEAVDARYLFHMVWSPSFRHEAARNMTGTAGQQRVPTNFFHRFKIPLPPLPEQRRIANILDKTVQILRKRETAMEYGNTIATSLFEHKIGDPISNRKNWDVVEMGTLYAIPPNYGTMTVPSESQKGWLDIRVANIQNGVLDLSDRKYVDLSPETLLRHEVKKGDLLLARAIGSIEHLGKCFVADPGVEHWAFDSHLMRLRFNLEKVDPRFIHAFFSSPGGRHEFLKNSRRSAVQFNINTKEMAKIRVPLPPIEIQLRFVRELIDLAAIRFKQQKHWNDASELFDSLASTHLTRQN